MRKILIIASLLFFIIQNCTMAQNVSFIYINGSNNNDKKMKTWFYKGVTKKLHPALVKRFKKDKKTILSSKNGYSVNNEPVIFFWGDKSRADLDYVEWQVDISNAVSSAGATLARTLITKYFHDAIWIQKTHNMLPILDELNDIVKAEWEKGNKVVLYGYSAGSFVNYEYILNKLPYIDIYKLCKSLKVDEEVLKYIEENPKQKTCVSAIRYGKIGVLSSAGDIIIDRNNDRLIENYSKMDEVTETYCAPKEAVLGTISFANPLALFYSELGDDDYEANFLNTFLMKHVIENGMFVITINFREDPLGIPPLDNVTIEEIEDGIGMKFENPTGTVYNNSSVWSGRPFFMAHTAYWNAKRIFPRAILKNLDEAYKFEYDPKVQKKILKKRLKINSNIYLQY